MLNVFINKRPILISMNEVNWDEFKSNRQLSDFLAKKKEN